MKKNFSSSDIPVYSSQNFDKKNENIFSQNIPNFNYDYTNNKTDNNDVINNNFERDDPNNIFENINNSNYNILQKQNENLKNQIIILTKRIKEYENNYIKDNNRNTNQLKEFSELETDLNNQIDKKNKIINTIKEENNYLKKYINQMDNDINILKDEVKNLLLQKKEKETYQNNQNIINSEQDNNYNNNVNNLIDLVKNYSDEIMHLKSQNANLINNLNILNNNNKKSIINEEIKKMKIIQKEGQLGFENFLNNFIKRINEELFVISQWIETYLGNEYDKGYEIPSLTNDIEKTDKNDKINLINFDLIKSSLEKAATELNSIINEKDTEIIKLTNIIREKESKYNEIKKEIIKINQKQIDLNIEKDQLILQQEQERKNTIINNTIINNLKQNDTNIKNNNLNYLKYLYEIIYKEINSILTDINLRPYHDKFINIKQNENIFNQNQGNNINLLEEKLTNSLIKLIEFIEELKYDYTQTKNDYMKFMKEKANNTKKMIVNNNNTLIDEYKFKIEELINNNRMLKEQINIINKNNDINLFKDDEMMIKCQNIENENKNLRYNNDNLLNKLKMANDNYLVLENENNELKRRMKTINADENNDNDLNQKINDLSMDYQRILKENSSLKKILNTQNFSNF